MPSRTFRGARGLAQSAPHQVHCGSPVAAAWIVTLPAQHPVWEQYWLSAVRVDAAARRFPDATHEVRLIPVDPTAGVVTVFDLNAPMPVAADPLFAEQVGITEAEVHGVLCAIAMGLAVGCLAVDQPGWPDVVASTIDELRAGVAQRLARRRSA